MIKHTIFPLTILALWASYCPLMNAMEPVAVEQEVQLKELVIESPEQEIHIPIPTPLSRRQRTTLLAAVSGGALALAGGITVVVLDRTHIANIILSSALLVCGTITEISSGIWYKYKLENQKIIHANFISHAKETIKRQRAQQWSLVVPKELTTQLCAAVTRGDGSRICTLISDINSAPLLPIRKFTPQETKDKRSKVLALFCSLKKICPTLPADLRYKILADCPELICNQQLFNRTLHHALHQDLLTKTLAHCPLSWFNYFYLHQIEQKDTFACTVAQAATEMRVDTLLALVPPEACTYTPEELDKTYDHNYYAFHQKITAINSK